MYYYYFTLMLILFTSSISAQFSRELELPSFPNNTVYQLTIDKNNTKLTLTKITPKGESSKTTILNFSTQTNKNILHVKTIGLFDSLAKLSMNNLPNTQQQEFREAVYKVLRAYKESKVTGYISLPHLKIPIYRMVDTSTKKTKSSFSFWINAVHLTIKNDGITKMQIEGEIEEDKQIVKSNDIYFLDIDPNSPLLLTENITVNKEISSNVFPNKDTKYVIDAKQLFVYKPKNNFQAKIAETTITLYPGKKHQKLYKK